MKFLIKSIIIVFSLFICSKSQGQDLHWTMFDLSPLSLNPATTGDYEGSFRIGANYRSQWNSISNATGYSTPSIYADAPIVMVGNRGWLGLGGMIYNDEVGGNNLNTFSAMGSAALHFGLNKKGTSVLSIGVQGGMIQYRMNTNNIILEEQIVLGGQNLPFSNSLNGSFLSNEPKSSFFDMNVGAKFYRQFNDKSNMTLGLAARHILSPEKNLLSGTNTQDLAPLIALHGKFKVGLNKLWSITPSFIFQQQSTASEVGLQALLGYVVNKENNIFVRFGPGYRAIGNDAIEAIIQVDYKGFRVGGAYDFNISDLATTTNNQGGFELALSYIAKIYKTPKVKSVIFCPQF